MNENHDSPANGQVGLSNRVKELQLGDRLDGRAAKGGGANVWLPWTLCILLAVAWAGVGIRWYKGSNNTAAPTAGEPVAREQAGKAKEAAKSTPIGEIVLESKGYLIPSHSISISPIDVSGRIIRLEIEEGKTFKAGQELAAIDPTRFQAIMEESKAQVAAAKARLQELTTSSGVEVRQADAELAEARAQRDEALIVFETAKTTATGAVAKLEISQSQKKYEAAEQRVKVLEQKLDLVRGVTREQKIAAAAQDLQAAEARLAQSKWQLDNCVIKAPVTGVILTKKAEIGSLINPVVGGVSTSLCEMADLSQIEVDLEIQERDISKIRKNMLCRVRSDAYPERLYMGYVDRMMPIANRARGIIPVRVKVVIPANEEQGRYLKPEMGVSVTFINQDADEATIKAAETGAEPIPAPKELKKAEPKNAEASK